MCSPVYKYSQRKVKMLFLIIYTHSFRAFPLDGPDASLGVPALWLTQAGEEEQSSAAVILNINRTPSDDTTCFTLSVIGGGVQCMCAVGDTMWLGLSNGSIVVYE